MPPFLDIVAIDVQTDEGRGSSLRHGSRAKVGSNLLSLRQEERECASVLVASVIYYWYPNRRYITEERTLLLAFLHIYRVVYSRLLSVLGINKI